MLAKESVVQNLLNDQYDTMEMFTTNKSTSFIC